MGDNGKATGDKSPKDTANEVFALVRDYAKQETVEPLKGLGRWISAGAGGSFLIATGISLVLLAALRALQTETGTTFTGNWSWVPYLIVLAGAAAVLGVSFWAVKYKKGR
jgi:hypothetical protein